jgi:cyclophilin family peptidyl-prolyl cis-trans isomerase
MSRVLLLSSLSTLVLTSAEAAHAPAGSSTCAPKDHSCSPTPGSYPDCCSGLTCDTDGGYVCRTDVGLAAPAMYFLDFQTDVGVGDGVISFNITRALAPLGADHLHTLVQDGFYDAAAFFRVVPDFVAQFGIAGEPAKNRKWDRPIPDDPVVQSNLKGSIVYATAGPNTRTTQLFINYKDNARLDAMGFAPLGNIVKGMDVAEAIFNPTPGDSGGVDQGQYTNKGNAWIKQQYPKINFIVNATIRKAL